MLEVIALSLGAISVIGPAVLACCIGRPIPAWVAAR